MPFGNCTRTQDKSLLEATKHILAMRKVVIKTRDRITRNYIGLPFPIILGNILTTFGVLSLLELKPLGIFWPCEMSSLKPAIASLGIMWAFPDYARQRFSNFSGFEQLFENRGTSSNFCLHEQLLSFCCLLS